MKWVGNMNRITRLAFFNIKKHKLETVSLSILVMLCMLLFTSAIVSEKNISTIFQQAVDNTQSKTNYILIPQTYYDPKYRDYLASNKNVSDIVDIEGLFTMNSAFINDKGDEQALYMLFLTEDTEKRVASVEFETTFSDDEIAALEHPIFLPFAARDTMNKQIGDSFIFVFGSKRIEFTIAGYFDTIIFKEPMSGFKSIITDEDYRELSDLIEKYCGFAYDTVSGSSETVEEEFITKTRDYSGEDIGIHLYCLTRDKLERNSMEYTDWITALMKVLSIMIAVSAAIVIRFRISGDIRDQLVSIGVLEALGYTSRDITLSYVAEYMMISVIGCITGGLGSMILSPMLYKLNERVSGLRGSYRVYFSPVFIVAAALCLFIFIITFVRADMVKKYPPVTAFRRGIADHNFKNDILPLRSTKKSVHLRIALKGIFNNIGQSITILICVGVSAAAVLTAFTLRAYFGDDFSMLKPIAGIEMSDWHVGLLDTADAYEAAEQIASMPGVRKCLPTSDMANDYLRVPDLENETIFTLVYKDYSQTENIFLCSGRFPEHNNEIMLTKLYAKVHKLELGDTITLEVNKTEKDFIVTGFVSALTNSGYNLYITEEGMKSFDPTWRPRAIEIYLEEGVDRQKFKEVLTNTYGKTIADVHEEKDGQGSTAEERIRAIADKKIAEMISMQGAVNVEYSVRIGDEVITGGSSGFIISSIQNYYDVTSTQLKNIVTSVDITTSLFTVIAAVAVMLIIFIIMEQEIRRQYKDLGVMLALGYTTNELMLQLALRILPSVLLAAAAGIAINEAIMKLLTSYFGKVTSDPVIVGTLTVIIVVFCFCSAYIGARKIKKISVYGLITE